MNLWQIFHQKALMTVIILFTDWYSGTKKSNAAGETQPPFSSMVLIKREILFLFFSKGISPWKSLTEGQIPSVIPSYSHHSPIIFPLNTHQMSPISITFPFTIFTFLASYIRRPYSHFRSSSIGEQSTATDPWRRDRLVEHQWVRRSQDPWHVVHFWRYEEILNQSKSLNVNHVTSMKRYTSIMIMMTAIMWPGRTWEFWPRPQRKIFFFLPGKWVDQTKQI